MYDSFDTDLSFKELQAIQEEAVKVGAKTGLIGGWATFLYVNENYRRAYGKDYMGSRDIDLFIFPETEEAFERVMKNRGFEENGYFFRYEKIYNRELKKYISRDEAKKEEIFNLVYIFLDLFSNKETKSFKTWWNLEPLKGVQLSPYAGFDLVDIDTLIALKCYALFERDRTDKENKDACDIYALLRYHDQKPKPTKLLFKAIEKLLNRKDLLHVIAENVLLDQAKISIVQVTLTDMHEQIKNRQL